jgi:hypothetical protein
MQETGFRIQKSGDRIQDSEVRRQNPEVRIECGEGTGLSDGFVAPLILSPVFRLLTPDS